MVTVQFLQKETTLTYIDVHAATYREELVQLTEQGFVVSGKPVTAETIKECLVEYKNRDEVTVKEYAILSVVCALFSVA
ncbi:hypothetical protein KW497_05420 [Vibrio fluvialis]|uniref:hypothetical protein n=1 Tax=Vibrio fluvialis TaxID=676 RepID=UPI00192B71B7|nr:hypothetical protein [Vibrio fluvialis]HDM8033408.1 hypothetical protein [Vibrio fluvialis clinical-1]EKO3385764.1 hypothetical protein [Vibrio fluvialis]EKO3393041.1 hypothetical protein [Vibrio fluvialis]EKO3410969.1 hypothetical protein [Vibrio fluvialis]EKO3420467.1 hypothetical protein [Vibrio fluvialis]